MTRINISFYLISFIVDVVSIPKTNENFRLLYDTKGRFRLHSVKDEEAKVNTFIVLFSLISFLAIEKFLNACIWV